jgi:peptidyl-prolyl cis-trans isomerase C
MPSLRAHLITAALIAILPPATGFTQISTEQPDQDPNTPVPLHAPTGAPQDPVLGSVDGKLIYLSDLTRVTNTLPEQMRNLPFDQIMPVLLDRMIDHDALTMTARRVGLDKQPDIQRDMRAAADLVLERAWLAQVTPPKVTDAAIAARYNRQYLNRPATDEVRARHILVGSEAEAQTVLDELKGGADFAAIARVVSKDPDGKQGGDLGFFRRDQVWPGFADAAFSLQPGQVAPKPVHNEFGWHVIKVEERRLVGPPTLSEVRDQIREDLMAQAVREAITDARSQMIIHKFNLDGSEIETAPRMTRAGSDR